LDQKKKGAGKWVGEEAAGLTKREKEKTKSWGVKTEEGMVVGLPGGTTKRIVDPSGGGVGPQHSTRSRDKNMGCGDQRKETLQCKKEKKVIGPAELGPGGKKIG